MASDRCLLISEPLCFARGRFGKLEEKVLKQILVDFYDANQLEIAKNRLNEDIAKLDLDKWPRSGQHRESLNKASLEVDDIMTMLDYLDRNLLLDNLPIYVSENIDRIPSVRWMDGDYQLLLAKMNKIQEENASMQEKIIEMQAHVAAQDEKLNALLKYSDFSELSISQMDHFEGRMRSMMADSIGDLMNKLGAQRAIHQSVPAPPGFTAAVNSHVPVSVYETNTMDITESASGPTSLAHTQNNVGLQREVDNGPAMSVNVHQLPPFKSASQSTQQPRTQKLHSQLRSQAGNIHHQPSSDNQNESRHANWGNIPSPGEFHPIRSNRQTFYTTSEHSYGPDTDDYDDDTGAWDTQRHQRRKSTRSTKKRRLETDADNQQLSYAAAAEKEPIRIKVVGKMQSTTTKIKAHSNIRSKKVFCVSNLDNDISAIELQQFMEGSGLTVVNCNVTKSKFDGKAFHVCIYSDDIDKFMSADMWPENVVIREWFLKNKQPSN